MLKKWGDPYMALLVYWATPLQNRFSPAELLMSCRLRTTIPATRKGFKPLAPDYQVVTDNRCQDRRETQTSQSQTPHLPQTERPCLDSRPQIGRRGGRRGEPTFIPGQDPRWYLQERQSCSPSSTPETGGKYTLFHRAGPGRQPIRHSAPTRAKRDDYRSGNWKSEQNRIPPDQLKPSWNWDQHGLLNEREM